MKMLQNIFDCNSFGNSKKNVCNRVYFSKVARIATLLWAMEAEEAHTKKLKPFFKAKLALEI